MTRYSNQSTQFYKDVAISKKLWTIKDEKGIPAPLNTDGVRAMPFWSQKEMAEKVIRTVPAYSGFEVQELSWSDFVSRWVPGMTKDGLLVGLNWTGKRAGGYDYVPSEVQKNVEFMIKRLSEPE